MRGKKTRSPSTVFKIKKESGTFGTFKPVKLEQPIEQPEPPAKYLPISSSSSDEDTDSLLGLRGKKTRSPSTVFKIKKEFGTFKPVKLEQPIEQEAIELLSSSDDDDDEGADSPPILPPSPPPSAFAESERYKRLLRSPAGRFHGRKYMCEGQIGTAYLTPASRSNEGDDGTYTLQLDGATSSATGLSAEQIEDYIANYDAIAGLSSLSGGGGGGGGGDSPRVRKRR